MFRCARAGLTQRVRVLWCNVGGECADRLGEPFGIPSVTTDLISEPAGVQPSSRISVARRRLCPLPETLNRTPQQRGELEQPKSESALAVQ
jgi:hypothetical protein